MKPLAGPNAKVVPDRYRPVKGLAEFLLIASTVPARPTAAQLAHGIQPLKEGYHPQLGQQRISVTLRKVAQCIRTKNSG